MANTIINPSSHVKPGLIERSWSLLIGGGYHFGTRLSLFWGTPLVCQRVVLHVSIDVSLTHHPHSCASLQIGSTATCAICHCSYVSLFPFLLATAASSLVGMLPIAVALAIVARIPNNEHTMGKINYWVYLITHRIHVYPCMLYMVTFTINIPPMLVYIVYIYIYMPYMDPMGYSDFKSTAHSKSFFSPTAHRSRQPTYHLVIKHGKSRILYPLVICQNSY